MSKPEYIRKSYPLGWFRCGRVMTNAELEKIRASCQRALERSMEQVK